MSCAAAGIGEMGIGATGAAAGSTGAFAAPLGSAADAGASAHARLDTAPLARINPTAHRVFSQRSAWLMRRAASILW